MGTVVLIIGFCLVVGIPLYFMINHLTGIVKRDYIFDVKVVRKKGERLEFRNDYHNHKLPVIKLNFNGEKYNFLIDTGADINILNKPVFDVISNGNIEVASNGLITTAGSDVVSEKAVVSFKYGNKNFTEEFVLMDVTSSFQSIFNDKNMQLHGVLGSEFFKKHKWSVDFDNMVIWTK